MIEVQGLTKRFGSTLAVDDLTFSVEPGRITGFLGPNGAGKSTTMRVILGLVRPTAGSTAVLGLPYPQLEDPVRRVGVLLETFDAHPGRTGRNHLRVLALAGGIPRSRVDEVLAMVDMSTAARRRVKGYSLGMRQRLGLAAALLGDPEVLVLDEPANGLDPQGIRWLRDFLRSLAAEGRTILVSSHVLSEVAQTVDDVVIIHRGSLVQHAAMAEVEAMAAGATSVRSPDADRLARLLEEANLDVSGRRRRQAGGQRGSRAGRRDRSRPRDRASRADRRASVARRGLPGAHRRSGRARRVSNLYLAELLKLRTLRSTWGFGVITLLFAGLLTAANIGGSTSEDRLDPELQFRIPLDVAFSASILALLMGIILVTNEFRHGTIARTLLATPRRGRFLAVKLLAGASAGACLYIGALVVAAVTAVIWLGALDVPLEAGEWGDGAWRALVATVIAGVFGAGIGGAVHSQVGALVGVLLWMFVLEPICWLLLGVFPYVDLEGVAEYLPAAALGGTVDSEGEGLSWARAVLVSLGWTALAAALAFVRTNRRDIT